MNTEKFKICKYLMKENKPEDVQHLKEDPELIKAEHNLIEKVHK